MDDRKLTVRSYKPTDRAAVRVIYGMDEFARPHLLERFPRMSNYIADEASLYFTEHEPESLFVAEAEGKVIGALLSAVDTVQQENIYDHRIRPLLTKRCLLGAYGFPLWIVPLIRTEFASRNTERVPIDLNQYPAHLHIGVLPAWRRKGAGTALMECYTNYLRQRGIAGFHLYASSYHNLGVAFYNKLGLEVLGQFAWSLHTGYEWLPVTETIFGRRV